MTPQIVSGWPNARSDGVMDIVERLRRQIATTNSNHLLCYEAADEIERLRKADEWMRLTLPEYEEEIKRLRTKLQSSAGSAAPDSASGTPAPGASATAVGRTIAG